MVRKPKPRTKPVTPKAVTEAIQADINKTYTDAALEKCINKFIKVRHRQKACA